MTTMLNRLALSALLASALVSLTSADPVPLTPGPGDIFREGADCTFTWTPDPTGLWKVMNVELMTGSNFAMVHLDTVATLDGTSLAVTSFTYPCPAVNPNSAIYFYQFTSPASSNRTWTTRFTIADPTGATTPPSEPTQPGTNEPIPWGIGALEDPSSARPAPPGGGGSGTPAANATTSVNATTSRSALTYAPPTTSRLVTSSSSVIPPTTRASAAATATSGAGSALAAAAGERALKALVVVGSAAVAFVVFL